MKTWKRANNPPHAARNNWSEEVVVITTEGNVFMLTYFGTAKTGCWQRPSKFSEWEKVEYWTETP